jgi:PAS domain S-box-containing protein
MSAAIDTIRVLHVDDDPALAELVATFLEREDDRIVVETATRVADGLERLSEVDCIVSDHDMPRQTGIEFLEAVREEYPDLPFILYTGKGSEAVAADAISAGVTDYLQKSGGTDQYAILANRIVNAVERYRIEREADRTRSQLQAIAENSADAIIVVDADSRVRFANPAVEEQFGFTPAELRGERLTAIMPERYRDEHLAAVDRYLDTGERSVNWSHVEFHGQHRDGTEIPLSVSFSEFRQDGERRFLGILRDVSERTRLESELREREARFRQVAENIEEVVWMSDSHKEEILYANPAYEDVWGRPVESLYDDPRSFLDAVHPDDRDRVRAAVDHQAAGEYDEVYRIVRPDGDERWIRDRAVPVRNDAGEVHRVVGVASDITEQKEQARKREQIIGRVTDAIVEVDADWRFTLVNGQAEDLYGMDESDLLGRDFWDVFDEARDSRFEEEYRAVMETREPTSFVEYFSQLDGWFDIEAYPKRDGGISFYFTEVTDRRERQRELEETNALLSTLFDALPQGVLVEDEAREVVAVNRRLFDLFDVPGTPSDAVGDDCERLAAEVADQFPDPDAFVDRIGALIDAGEPVANEELTLADGRQFARTYRPIDLRDGHGHLWVYRDVTEQRASERELREEQLFIEQSLDVLQDVFFVFSRDGDLLRWNDQLCELTGYTEDELADMGPTDFFPEEHRSRISDTVEEILETGSATVHADVQPRDGERTPHEFIGTRLTDEDGEILGFAGIGRDITERRERERELVRTRDLLERTERIADVGGWEIDTETMDIFWTEHLFDILGVDYDEEPPLDEALDVHHEDDRPIVANAVERALDTGESFDVEVRFRRPDGEVRWLRVYGTPTVADGDVVALRGAVQDVTERKTHEQRLERQNDRLEQFASVVSHDLRNPLNVAEGHLALAREECDSEHLAQAARAQERMSVLIDDLLTLAREGEQVGEMETADLATIAEAGWGNVSTVGSTLVTDGTRTLRADRSRLQQLLENLVRNAVEHGSRDDRPPSGDGAAPDARDGVPDDAAERTGADVTVTVGTLPDGFYVADDGDGIPADERDRVFEVGHSTSETGTGFGLSIVEQIAEAHGWTVQVTESDAGGARFEITGVEFVDD